MATSVSHSASSLLLDRTPRQSRHFRSSNHQSRSTSYMVRPSSATMNQLTTARHGTACSTSKLTGNSIASSVNKEFIFVSDERGIQGRLEERAGTALGAVFVAQPRDLKLDAFKSVLPPYPGHKKAPDFMLITVAHKAKVVGEAKFPWIPEHYQRDLVREFEAGIIEEPFRHALGQIAQYIIELGPKYGFLTTYDQTIFLREADVT